MISGTADDRLAFVIETEAKLDAIKQARTEVRGIGTDSEVAARQMASASTAQAEANVTTVAGTKNMGAWAAMQAEAASHVGEHSLAVGRLEMSLARFSGTALGVSPVVEMLTASLSRFAFGTIETAGALLAVAGIIEAYKLFTAAATEAAAAQEKLVKAGEARWQPVGLESAPAKEFNALLTERAELTKRLGPLQNALDDTLTSSSYLARTRTQSEVDALTKRLHELQLSIATAEANKGGALKTVTTESGEKKDEAEANRLFAVQLRDASREGTAATGSVDKMLAAHEKALAKLAAGEEKGAAMHAELQAKTLEATLRTLDQEMKAKLAANDAEYTRRQQDIANLDVTEKRKTELLRDNANLRVATEAQIREAAADKVEKGHAAAEAKLVAAEKRKEAIMLHSIDAFVRGAASTQKLLIQMALNPIIKELEGTAVRQFVRAAAAWPNFAAMAQHAAAGALAVAGAREVAQLGEMAGGGGSSSGGGSAGGSGSSSTFEPRSGTEGAGSVTIQLYSQNPYGAEQIQELKYQLNRAGILKIPVPISPTKQLTGGR